ncbi:MAG: alpha/beta hydrolase [Archangium sp.]|nr:alpha/beta hydrolase [Archangium sp.]
MNRALHTPPLRGPGGHVLPTSIAEASFLELGGVKQWVLIRGQDTANPPLIFLHGGPGMSEAGFFRFYNAPLEQHFTCVHWDQRGAGKSFDETIPKASMTIEQFLADLDGLVDHVRRRVGQDKVVLLGHSWGSALGVLYAARFPQKVSVYVGTGQIGDATKGEAASYAFALAEAERQGKRKALEALRAIGAPPYSAEKLWIERNCLARLEGGMSPRAMLRMLRMVLGVPESSLLEVPGSFRALKWSIEAMWAETSRLNLLEAAPVLKVPVFFFLGRKDHWVPPETSVAYFEMLMAPSKELLWFEHSGHEPFADEPARFNAAMIERVLPTARQAEHQARSPLTPALSPLRSERETPAF